MFNYDYIFNKRVNKIFMDYIRNTQYHTLQLYGCRMYNIIKKLNFDNNPKKYIVIYLFF